MKNAIVGEWSELSYVIADRNCSFSPGTTLTGNDKLPIIVPKGSKI